jgi:hypothetical protein
MISLCFIVAMCSDSVDTPWYVIAYIVCLELLVVYRGKC